MSEQSRTQTSERPEAPKLVRVVAPHFVAGFETDGIVLRAAPIIKYLIGKSNEEARAYIARKGWKASIVQTTTTSPRNLESGA